MKKRWRKCEIIKSPRIDAGGMHNPGDENYDVLMIAFLPEKAMPSFKI